MVQNWGNGTKLVQKLMYFLQNFIKYFKRLSSALQLLLNDIMETKDIPKSWNETNISLIPKEAQDLTNGKNYRPISLLNNDYKIFARILKIFLKDFVGEEQAGFLPNRRRQFESDN